jgi:protein MBA1
MTWELLSYKPSLPIPIFDVFANPRVVSNRMAQLPIPGAESRETPTAIRQVVLRISSKQRLGISRESASSTLSGSDKRRQLKWTPDGEEILAEEEELAQPDVHEKDVVEYLVLQRRLLKGEEEPWKVWGFANATTLESIEKNEEQEKLTLEYNAAHPSALG